MRLVRCALLLIEMLLLSAWVTAEHNPLLPRPQKVQYGAGQLAVQGLSIQFAPSPSREDRFAAKELSRALAERAGIRVPIRETPGSGSAIVLNRTGAVDPLPMPGERPGPESREAYQLKVTPAGVEISARSSVGVFYAVQTLRQLVEGEGEGAVLPEVEIQDWPAMAYRGTMVDMSHGPLPTEEEIKRQIDFLARWKANQYYLYSEASIELDGYPLLNPDGHFTKAQVRRVVAYGRERHIDVIPNLELYGHLHDLFRVEKYSDLAVFPHGGEFNPRHPKVKALLGDWIDQLARLFPSPFVHIGFDETWQIEMAAKQQVAGAAPAKLFTQQLADVTRLFQQRGKTVMAWGDIIVKYPEIVEQLPAGLIPVAWDYDATPDTKKWLNPLVAKGLPHFVQSGVANWREIALDFDLTFANIDNFLAAGRRSKAFGLINSVWTDSAQGLLRLALPAIAYGACAPWQSVPMDRVQFFSDYARLVYPPKVAPEAAAALEKLNQAEVRLQEVFGQDTVVALWSDPFASTTLKNSSEHREDLRETRLVAEDALEHLYRALSLGGDLATLNSLLIGSRMLDYAGWKFLNAIEIAELWQAVGPRPTGDQWWNEFESGVTYQSHGRLADMMDAISELREIYRAAWLAEYTPYRLASALGRWDAEYEYWRRLQARFQAFSKSHREGDALPPLESLTGPR